MKISSRVRKNLAADYTDASTRSAQAFTDSSCFKPEGLKGL